MAHLTGGPSPLLPPLHGTPTIYELIWNHELEPIHIGRSVRLTIDDLEDYVQRKRAA